MNPVGQPLKQHPVSRKLVWISMGSLLLFLALQILPVLFSDSSETGADIISKAEARQAGAAFAAENLGYVPSASDEWRVTYQTDSDFYGYMSKEKLLQDYSGNQYEQKFPYDVYRVSLVSEDTEWGRFNVDVNMYNGNIAGFTRLQKSGGSDAVFGMGLAASEGNRDHSLSTEEKQALSRPWLEAWEADYSVLTPVTNEEGYGLVYLDPSRMIGDSTLRYYFKFDEGQVSAFEAKFAAPSAHADYVERQTSLATTLTLLGYGLPTLLLGVLALVYSILCKSHTSFVRGSVLSFIHFVIMMVSTYNAVMELPTTAPESALTRALTFVFYTVYSLIMSALLYFSLVGGDGLWRKEEGLNPWPRAKEPGYGAYVLESVKHGYLWAFILMGVQSIIFLILQVTLGSWSTTDSAQSPINMQYAWLLPIIAWLAGLSEEAVYRLFGIRMLKKIVRSTWVAAFITTVIWALGHTLYPIFPISTRPIELTVIGLMFSFIFLRYGFITAMFSHVVFDSVLMGLTLILMGDASNVSAGAVAIALPFIVGYLVYRFNPPGRSDSSPPPQPLPPLG